MNSNDQKHRSSPSGVMPGYMKRHRHGRNLRSEEDTSWVSGWVETLRLFMGLIQYLKSKTALIIAMQRIRSFWQAAFHCQCYPVTSTCLKRSSRSWIRNSLTSNLSLSSYDVTMSNYPFSKKSPVTLSLSQSKIHLANLTQVRRMFLSAAPPRSYLTRHKELPVGILSPKMRHQA